MCSSGEIYFVPFLSIPWPSSTPQVKIKQAKAQAPMKPLPGTWASIRGRTAGSSVQLHYGGPAWDHGEVLIAPQTQKTTVNNVSP